MKSKKSKSKFSKISKNDLISDIVRKNPKAGEVLFESGLSCIGCPIAVEETLEEGCMLHGMDVDEVLAKINKS